MPTCNKCRSNFPDFKSLALHIISNKKTHKQGLKWASQYITRQRQLDRKVTAQRRGRVLFTDEDRDNKEDLRRVLSGQTIISNILCPRCKRGSIRQLPIEHAGNPEAWRVGKALVVLCINCGGNL